ncbi:hypothetical protein F4821DRAFT_278572 [Hypoxylon rubiginosum]|uniref:Uncharacterized protein n=1 Tax=Hypoxylon rubiginosum TaxID=110542 RepID=A0ACC0D0W1_9PEZI|nr:hypothetical protein F4821DRAFT_278572 [Hypoxylon rubiginosum]
MAKSSRPKGQREQLLVTINSFQRQDTAGQTQELKSVLEFLKLPNEADEVPQALSRLINRQKHFKSLSGPYQLAYMRHLTEWRRGAPREETTGASKINRKEIERTVMLFPLVCDFQDCVRNRNFNEKRDGNWFVWWLHQHPGWLITSETNQGKVEEDRDLLYKLILDGTKIEERVLFKSSHANTKSPETRPWAI